MTGTVHRLNPPPYPLIIDGQWQTYEPFQLDQQEIKLLQRQVKTMFRTHLQFACGHEPSETMMLRVLSSKDNDEVVQIGVHSLPPFDENAHDPRKNAFIADVLRGIYIKLAEQELLQSEALSSIIRASVAQSTASFHRDDFSMMPELVRSIEETYMADLHRKAKEIDRQSNSLGI